MSTHVSLTSKVVADFATQDGVSSIGGRNAK